MSEVIKTFTGSGSINFEEDQREDLNSVNDAKSLSDQVVKLKQLEDDGVINRKVYTKKPPLKVEYSLTEFGMTLKPLLWAIARWGHEVSTGEPLDIRY